MNIRYSLALGTSALALALAACGGGAGGGSSAVPAPVLTAAPTPTPTPNYPARPSAQGDTFAFTGTFARNDTYIYPFGNPLPPSSSNAKVTQQITVSTTPNPFGAGTVQDFKTAESDVYPQQTLASTTDLYVQSGSTFSLLGSKSLDDAGDLTNIQYTTPQVIDQLPETSGASWTNSPAAAMTQQFADGATAVRTVNSDGSYADTETVYAAPSPAPTNYPSTQAILTENADGSGELSEIRYENGRPSFHPNEVVYYDFLISKPIAQSAASQVLSFSYQYIDSYVGGPSPAPAQVVAASPVWYTTPLALYNETDKDLGKQSIPTACNAPSALGSTAMQIEQKVTSTDTVLGTLTTSTTDEYVVAGYGPVCVQLASTVDAYYDYNNDTTLGMIVYQGSQPLQTTTITQTLTIGQQAPSTQVRRQAAANSTAGALAPLAPISSVEIAASRAQIARVLERDREKRIGALTRYLNKYAAIKGDLK